MEIINSTTRYTHKEKGGVYKILYVHQMKHPDSREWIPCVTYKSVIDNRVWTRSLTSFLLNFNDYCEKVHKEKEENIKVHVNTSSPVGK